jgi:DNA-binding MarR family transcriptional regulator
MLRLAHQGTLQELARWLADSPFSDLQPAQCAAIQALWDEPEGVRLTQLAETARITKQSMSAIVDHLERTGYVERLVDPDDARASRLVLTQRGRAFGKQGRAFSRRLRERFGERVGERRLAEFEATLGELVAMLGRESAD